MIHTASMVDVCLVLEHTYPYRTGGVSTWTHALVSGLPGRTFAVAHLHGGAAPQRPVFPSPPGLAAVAPIRLPEAAGGPGGADAVAALVPRVPRARRYHALSTGYAGLLAAAAARAHGAPLLLTEHGIYSREIALSAGEAPYGGTVRGPLVGADGATARLEGYARTAYAAADVVVTLSRPNQAMQRALGAPAEKMRLVPNGVTLPETPAPLRTGPPAVGLVGRVARIKDIETFVRACAHLAAEHPEARFYVVGPPDGDPAYARACRRLAARLVPGRLTFTGAADAHAWYPRLDVVVLTSRSEGQPLALLEAMSHARPVVATDVGDCRALVLGPDDGFGPAGRLCPPGDDAAVARAVSALLADPSARRTLGAAGRRRVADRYTEAAFLAAYDALYDEATADAAPGAQALMNRAG